MRSKDAQKQSARTSLKSLRENEHYNERELRNLKRDLKRKEQSLGNALAEKQELLDDIDDLEGGLRDSQKANEKLNARIDELKDMVKELKEAEILKGSKEKLLSFQADPLTAEAPHFKACELDFTNPKDETSSLKDRLEVQLDTYMNEDATITSERTKNLMS